MNAIKKLSKYGNRTFDYAVVHGAEIGKDKVAELSLVRPGVSTGIQKLMQRYIIELLTPANDLPFYNRGCDFIQDVLRAQTEEQVRTAFTFANASITEKLRNEAAGIDDLNYIEEDEGDDALFDRVEGDSLTVRNPLPDDETLDYAELTDVSFIGDTVSISIALYNKAGSEYEIILPIYEL